MSAALSSAGPSPVAPARDDRRMRTERSRRLRDGRLLTWVHVQRRAACATAEDYYTEGSVDGVPIDDIELARLVLA